MQCAHIPSRPPRPSLPPLTLLPTMVVHLLPTDVLHRGAFYGATISPTSYAKQTLNHTTRHKFLHIPPHPLQVPKPHLGALRLLLPPCHLAPAALPPPLPSFPDVLRRETRRTPPRAPLSPLRLPPRLLQGWLRRTGSRNRYREDCGWYPQTRRVMREVGLGRGGQSGGGREQSYRLCEKTTPH